MAANKRRLRARWLGLHRWLGLPLGLVFALVGVSGTLLGFYPELDLALNPPPHALLTVGPDYSWQPVADRLRRAYPAYDGPWRIEVPLAPGRPILARYYHPPERPGKSFGPRLVSLDPATLAILQDRYWGDGGLTWVYDLHYTLFLDRSGRQLLAGMAALLLLSLVSGLWLWWPTPGHWRERSRWRIRPGRVRATYDWHVLSGLYSAPLLALLLLTGLVLEIPEPVERLLQLPQPAPPTSSPPAPGQRPITLDQALVVARHTFPGAQPRWLEIPPRAGGLTHITLWQPGEPGRRFPKTQVWLDPQGHLLAQRNPLKEPTAPSLMRWLHPLHNGECLGLPGRLAITLAGLLPLGLWVSGWMRWRQKKNGKASLQNKEFY